MAHVSLGLSRLEVFGIYGLCRVQREDCTSGACVLRLLMLRPVERGGQGGSWCIRVGILKHLICKLALLAERVDASWYALGCVRDWVGLLKMWTI